MVLMIETTEEIGRSGGNSSKDGEFEAAEVKHEQRVRLR
jgi:hypothetical protein